MAEPGSGNDPDDVVDALSSPASGANRTHNRRQGRANPHTVQTAGTLLPMLLGDLHHQYVRV